jgi:hypothetical protein
MVVQVTVGAGPASMGIGAAMSLPPAAPPVPSEAVPPPLAGAVPLEPEHVPISLGLQTKPAPQSASALHGSIQR